MDWTSKADRTIKGPNFEITFEVGSHNASATAELMNDIQKLVMAKGLKLFPIADLVSVHKPCHGCPNGLMQPIPQEFRKVV